MSTRYCAGITSSRDERSSPITCIAPPQHRQAVFSGSMTISTRGRCSGSEPRPARRVSARARLNAGSAFSCWASVSAIACSTSSSARLSWSGSSFSERRPNRSRCSWRIRWRRRSFWLLASRAFSARSASRSAQACGQHRAQRGDVVRQRLGGRVHGPIGPCNQRLAASRATGESIRRSSPGHLGPRNPRRVYPPPIDARRATTHRDTPIADGDLSGAEEIEVTDPRHPLYGRRFRLLTVTSGVRSAQLARVVYRPDIFLLLPISVTSLHPPTTRSVPTKLCLEALEDLLRVTAEREGECRSTPTTSGEACRPACVGRSRTTLPPCSGR